MSLLFGVAAIHKLRSPTLFRAAMAEYQMLPPGLLTPVSGILIMVELLAAVLILIPAMGLAGAAMMITLLVVYSIGIGINLLRGRRDIDCGCNGPRSKQVLSWWLVIRNLVFVALIVLAAGPIAARELIWLDVISVLFGVLTASILYLSLNQLLAQAPGFASLRSNA